MPRPKKYNESEVVDKAMDVFWQNGFKRTTARDMEEAMGINLFSIYSSFGSKGGVLLEALKAYKKLNQEVLLGKLRTGNSIEDIEQYFRDFLVFTEGENGHRGCLLINTAREFGPNLNPQASALIAGFSEKIMFEFKRILSLTGIENPGENANFLFVSLVGLITTAQLMTTDLIEDFLKGTFSRF